MHVESNDGLWRALILPEVRSCRASCPRAVVLQLVALTHRPDADWTDQAHFARSTSTVGEVRRGCSGGGRRNV